jgi:hypothetical protein
VVFGMLLHPVAHEIRTDEAGSACHQESHGRPS